MKVTTPPIWATKMDIILEWIERDPRYLDGIEYGEVRPGHPEASVKNHIQELLDALEEDCRCPCPNCQKLRILIHVHDTFKGKGKQLSGGKPVALAHQHSHASLAADYLRRLGLFELADIAQYHDEIFALWKKFKNKGEIDTRRLKLVKKNVKDLELYFDFVRRDSGTPGKRVMPEAKELKEFIDDMERLIYT